MGTSSLWNLIWKVNENYQCKKEGEFATCCLSANFDLNGRKVLL